ncbi:MAG: hypothetical protein R3C13_11300 [Hyphomonas sp.]|uniref:hypothetical protein n=1 Tax=Hyphomonas sp. TaxID=87 RepID=UPI003528C88A
MTEKKKPEDPKETPDHRHIRPAGPENMEDPPEEWDKVDEESDESFPASNPPGNDWNATDVHSRTAIGAAHQVEFPSRSGRLREVHLFPRALCEARCRQRAGGIVCGLLRIRTSGTADRHDRLHRL